MDELLYKPEDISGLIPVTYQNEEPVVSARDLHEFLDVKTPYDKWFPRMCEYGFTEGVDYSTFLSKSTGGRPAQDACVKLDMAKELCMLQRNERGKQARQYFIEVEKRYNSPEQLMARALRVADKTINSLTARNEELEAENAIMRPKAEYVDELVDEKLNLTLTAVAKELHMKRKALVTYLLENKFLYRSGRKGPLLPCEAKNDGYFEVREGVGNQNGYRYTYVQTLVTPKGRELLRLLCRNPMEVKAV